MWGFDCPTGSPPVGFPARLANRHGPLGATALGWRGMSAGAPPEQSAHLGRGAAGVSPRGTDQNPSGTAVPSVPGRDCRVASPQGGALVGGAKTPSRVAAGAVRQCYWGFGKNGK